jgi:hypothetical protein
MWWYHHCMTTATAQAAANNAFIKLVQWNTNFCHRKAVDLEVKVSDLTKAILP